MNTRTGNRGSGRRCAFTLIEIIGVIAIIAILVAVGFTERLFTAAIGIQTFDSSALTGRIHVRSQTATSAGSVTAATATVGGDNFDLDRDATTADFTSGSM